MLTPVIFMIPYGITRPNWVNINAIHPAYLADPLWCHLTHWGRVTHICVGNLTIICSDNGLLPGRRQAIIWTNAGILLIRPWGTNFSEILIEIHAFSFKKMHLKLSSAKWHPFCLDLNVLSQYWFRWWLATWNHQALTNVDLSHK